MYNFSRAPIPVPNEGFIRLLSFPGKRESKISPSGKLTKKRRSPVGEPFRGLKG